MSGSGGTRKSRREYVYYLDGSSVMLIKVCSATDLADVRSLVRAWISPP